jgi:hypothetical protein
MTKAIVTTLLASGLLLAAKSEKPAKSDMLSRSDRDALETMSPRVRVPGKHHKKHATDRVVSDKQTINAYVQPGK